MNEDLREECHYYEEEHDMGATIPICRKDGSVCDGCQNNNLLSARCRSDIPLLLFLIAFAGNIDNSKHLSEPPKPFEKEGNNNNCCGS